MAHATVKMGGKTYVLVPDAEYRDLTAARATNPKFPSADADGKCPAVQTGRASIAREIIRRRQAVGLSQTALATSACI